MENRNSKHWTGERRRAPSRPVRCHSAPGGGRRMQAQDAH